MADSFKLFPMNQQQILLDWINTIDEPNCLLASNLEDLLDGNVFLEIIINILRKNKFNLGSNKILNKFKSFYSMDIEMKYKLIFDILNDLVGEEKLSHFNPKSLINIEKNMMLSFVSMLREIYESQQDMSVSIDLEKYTKIFNEDEAYLQTDKNKNTQTNNLTFDQEMNYVKNTFGNEQFNSMIDDIKTVTKSNNNQNYKNNKFCKNPKYKEENHFEYVREIESNRIRDEYPMKMINGTHEKENKNRNHNQSEENENHRLIEKNENHNHHNHNQIISDNNNYLNPEHQVKDEDSDYENLEINTLASQNINPEENKKKYSFSKKYETDREEKPKEENYCYPIPITLRNKNNKTPLKDNTTNRSNMKDTSHIHKYTTKTNYVPSNTPRDDLDKSPSSKNTFRNIYNKNPYIPNKREELIRTHLNVEKNDGRLPKKPSYTYIQTKYSTNQPIDMKITNATKLDIIQASSRPITPSRGRLQIDSKKETNKYNLANCSNKSNLDISNLSNKSRSVSPTPSISDIDIKNNNYLYLRNNMDMLNLNTKFDYNKIYSKREKAELNLIRGCLMPTFNIGSSTGQKNNYQIEINNYKLNLFKFLKPTMPVVNIDFTSSSKYQPSAVNLKNSILINKTKECHKQKFNGTEEHKNLEENTNENEGISSVDIQDHILNNNTHTQNTNINLNINNAIGAIKSDYSTCPRKLALGQNYVNGDQADFNNFNKNHKPAVPPSLKNKIYFWLVDINILKENAIKVDDIPLLCTNGVLLCDLINRLEGKSETIKGIIRKTTSKTHIQININKVLEYLRNIGKVNNRHLWSGLEIASGDEKTIWEFMDDIWYFYSNKNHDITNRRRKKKVSMPVSTIPDNINNLSNLKNNISHAYNTNYNPPTNLIAKEKTPQLNYRGEPITLREANLNNIKNKLIDYEIMEEIEKHADLASIQKNLSNEISSALIKNSKQYEANKSKLRSETNTKSTNSEIIAKNLGLTKIRKKGESISNISRIANSHNTSNQTTSHNNREIKKAHSNLNFLPYYSSRPNSSHLNLNNKTKSSKLKPSTINENKSKEVQKDCFVIFQKTNAKKLQKEIERYNTLVTASAYNSENSLMIKKENDEISNKNIYYTNHYGGKLLINNFDKNDDKINIPRQYSSNQSKQFYSHSDIPNLITEDSKNPLQNHKVLLTDNERDEMILKEWLMGIGSKSAYKIDFSNEVIDEFKDGILLAEIISILENKKVIGINPNAKSKDASLKNISRCLEILRNKKNMPYDYLWSEEDIFNGNPHVIKALLKQLKNVYQKESEFIQNQINNK